MKIAKQKFRKIQRQESALERIKLYNEITSANIEKDQRLFYKLVNKQRNKQHDTTDHIILDGSVYSEYDNIIEGWKLHFENLAKPKENNDFDSNNKAETESNVLIIESICVEENTKIKKAEEDEIRKIIVNLKNNKAADIMGLTAEHLKMALDQVTPSITRIINAMLERGEVPHILKTGVLTPVLKKGKDKTRPGNYRGVTVTTLLGKILETYIRDRLEPILDHTQSQLQRGFTQGTSPLMAGLLISEAYYEAKDKKEPLILQTFDAEKAFDVVWHDSLFSKLYIQRRGRGGSVEYFPEGVKIGTLDVTSPTCADDIALLSKALREAQILTNIVELTANGERFTINPTKSEILVFKTNSKSSQEVVVKYGNNQIKQVTSLKHLGIERNETNTPNITQRIETTRKTLYALLGSGLHGKNGISPAITIGMWNTFVIPRMLHGIEFLNVRRKDLDQLEMYQRKILKQLQTLPERTASAAVLALVGAKPIEAHIDTKKIISFLNITKDPTSIEHNLATRQLIVKSHDSSSWFINVKALLSKYDLPDPLYPLRHVRDEKGLNYWKKQAKIQINDFWHLQRRIEFGQRATLSHLCLQPDSQTKPHLIWTNSKHSPNATYKAIIKAQIATDTYRLQANRSRYNQHDIKPDCKLCEHGPEDRKHFILICPSLRDIRTSYLKNLENTLKREIGAAGVARLLGDRDELLDLLIDCSNLEFVPNSKKNRKIQEEVESLARNLVYALHCLRANILSQAFTSDS
ncbi:hypothetical protein FSP39_020278 [Pinctada imbricata]|uniref:Reverse transcriptase domain-containing protein n=1 Tax=Pinctada imbricata TaxID=66713 RepID=A0AA89C8C0_PINIB|nr:hypothetical protein FSP39_020278 [Pinctada imbricata]